MSSYINDHQDEHWVNNPLISDRQKIEMFDEVLTLSEKIGKLKERERIMDLIKRHIVEFNASDNPWEKEFIAGLELLEGLIKDDLDRLKA